MSERSIEEPKRLVLRKETLDRLAALASLDDNAVDDPEVFNYTKTCPIGTIGCSVGTTCNCCD